MHVALGEYDKTHQDRRDQQRADDHDQSGRQINVKVLVECRYCLGRIGCSRSRTADRKDAQSQQTQYKG